MTVQTGFIGLGSQGGPIAHRMLDGGFPLMVWARRPEALEPFTAKGASAAATVTELGAACDHVGICVIDDAGVLDICETLIPAMRSGSLLAIHSTILPDTCMELERRCGERGIRLLDAPVSGGAPAAEAGTLTVMCGGSAEAFEQARPVIATFAGMVVLLGPAGCGQRAKIVNNTLLAANMGLAQAALDAGEALGIDRKALGELVKASSGRSFGFEIVSRLPSPAAFAHGAPLLAKDTNLLRDILPSDPAEQLLRSAAQPFLQAATGKPL